MVDNVRRGSPVAADVYLRRLRSICFRKGVTPRKMLENAGRNGGGRWAFNFLADLVTEMESERKTGSCTASNAT